MSFSKPIAARELDFTYTAGHTESVKVLLGEPVEVDEHVWHCSYLIKAESFERSSHAAGDDSMQALILAVFKISVDLKWLEGHKNGTFRLYGGIDLGFSFPGAGTITRAAS